MQIKAEAVAREPRKFQNQTTWAVKCNDKWYDVHQVQRPNKGDVIEGELKTQDSNGRTYLHFWPSPQSAAKAVSSNGHGGNVRFADYARAMKMFHAIASDLEHDDPQARAALVNTAMIAYSNGKIELPPPLDEPPPPEPFAGSYEDYMTSKD